MVLSPNTKPADCPLPAHNPLPSPQAPGPLAPWPLAPKPCHVCPKHYPTGTAHLEHEDGAGDCRLEVGGRSRLAP